MKTRVLIAAVLSWILCVGSAAGDESQAIREKVSSLSDAAKRDLQNRRERFNKLSPESQERIRDLHQKVENSGDPERLVRVMERYVEWLKTLSPIQRAEIQKLSPDERVKRIGELKQRNERSHFHRMTGAKIKQEDRDRIYNWLTKFAKENEDQIRKYASGQEITDRSRMFVFVRAIFRSNRKVPRLTEEQRADLVSTLSKDAQGEYESASSEQAKTELVRRWVFATVTSRMNPDNISRDELMRFYNEELSDEQREIISRSTGDRFQQTLKRLYFFSKLEGIENAFRGFDRFGPRGRRWGRPGDRRRSGGDRERGGRFRGRPNEKRNDRERGERDFNGRRPGEPKTGSGERGPGERGSERRGPGGPRERGRGEAEREGAPDERPGGPPPFGPPPFDGGSTSPAGDEPTGS